MSQSDLELNIKKDLEQLKEILSHLEAPPYLDSRFMNLETILTDNPDCFITVAPSCLKIRSNSNDRLAKIDADFNGAPKDIGLRLTAGMRNKDIAYMFLLALEANDKWDLVKFNYRGSQPRAKEITMLSKVKDTLSTLTAKGPITIRLGSSTWLIDDIENVPKVPKADFVFTLNGVPQIHVSYKHYNKQTSLVNSFRQYSGISKFCLGDFAYHEEINSLISDLHNGFTEAGFKIKNMRRGSYFAKSISDEKLICASMFGKEYENTESNIHNADAILQGDIKFVPNGNEFILDSCNTIHNPRHTNGILLRDKDFDPHFIVIKSSYCHQHFENVRISIWPCNAAVKKGLDNFRKFFIDKNFQAFI